MKFLQYVFSYEFQRYLDIEAEIDSRVSPSALIKQLQNQKILQKFIKTLNKPTTNSIKLMRRYHVCGLLIGFSNIFYDVFLEQVKIPKCLDQWLQNQVMKPYAKFLQKCCSSSEQYMNCKNVIIKQNVFDHLFFCINILKLAFRGSNKVHLLGKFYKKKNLFVFSGFIEMLAVQAKQLYFCFKSLMITILQDTDRYIMTQDHELILKDILMDDLAIINQEMKMLLLNKQFYPYGKSIGLKLFRHDQATQELQKTMKSIVTDHCQTNRRMDKQEINEKLFNTKEGFNVKYFEQSLSGTSPIMGLKRNRRFSIKNQQFIPDLPDDEQDDKQPQKDTSKQQEQNQCSEDKRQVETNQSNVNKVQSI